MLSLSEISKWNFTNVYSHPPGLLHCPQAAEEPAGFFQRLSFHEDLCGVGNERWGKRACRTEPTATLEQADYAEHILVAMLMAWDYISLFKNFQHKLGSVEGLLYHM